MRQKNAVGEVIKGRGIARRDRMGRSRVSRRAAVHSRVMHLGAALIAPALGLLLLFTGCGANPKAASKENFLKAIQAFEQADPRRSRLCSSLYTSIEEASSTSLPSIRDAESFSQKAGLAKLGYLTITDVTTQGLFGPEAAVRIAVTPKYVQVFGMPSSSNAEVCVGTASVEHVDDFTAPAEMMGYQISQVEATVKQTVTADWTRDKELTTLMNYDVPKPERKQQYVLVLKDSGWVVDSLR